MVILYICPKHLGFVIPHFEKDTHGQLLYMPTYFHETLISFYSTKKYFRYKFNLLQNCAMHFDLTYLRDFRTLSTTVDQN